MKARLQNKKRSIGKTTSAVPPLRRREMILLGLCTLLLCGIYLWKAYNMDDPLVVWTAQRIAAHPADFYGFDVNWYGYSAPVAKIDMNPPGAAYYVAAFGALFGWREPALHVAVALIAAAFVLGVYRLARQMGGNPLLAAGVALVSPGVLVSMGTVMTDLLMTALWVWALVLWLRGLEDERPAANILSAFLIGLAVLTKYFAFSLVPLLLAYTFLSGRRRWVRAVWLTIPAVFLVLFDWYTQRLYGMGLIRGLLRLTVQYHEAVTIHVGRKLLTGLTFLGAGGAPALFFAPWLWRRTGRMALCLGGAAMAIITVVLARSGWQVGEPQVSFPWWFWPQYGLWLLAGLHVIALALVEAWSRRDRDAMLLGLWLCGTLFYEVFVYHFVNIRVVLPALPIVALLCARRLCAESESVAPALPRPAWLAMAAGLVLCLCVAHADIRLANSARDAAARIAPEKRSGRTWFSGHWGFQYYMQERGAKPIDLKHLDFRLGDTVVTPANASNRLPARPRVASRNEGFELPVCSWLTTMRAECGAGFYADLWGPLPFVFGPVPNEQYEVTVIGAR
jgi:4-amino-4-deoxy-L-arabinose transferase-like glycosyltransferase